MTGDRTDDAADDATDDATDDVAAGGGTRGTLDAPAPGVRSVRFVPLPRAAMAALLEGDLRGASAAAGVALTGFFVSGAALSLWRRRTRQLDDDPASAPWIARAAVAEPEGVIGYAGFHGPPDEAGMVEIGYSVDPAHRRRGYARAMLRELLRHAAAHPDVVTVRATIRPDNAPSLATIAGHGFTRVGEQWDEEDGLEIIFEASAGDNSGNFDTAAGWGLPGGAG